MQDSAQWVKGTGTGKGEAGRKTIGGFRNIAPIRAGLRATWLGHSTVLLEFDGVRLLTDPVWGLWASPSQLAGPKPFQPMPVALKDLPPIDAVLVSHDHYDHLCYPTMRALAKTQIPFIKSWGLGAHHRTGLVAKPPPAGH